MHETTSQHTTKHTTKTTTKHTTKHTTKTTIRALLASALLALLSLACPAGTGSASGDPATQADASRPHVIRGAVADVLVRVRGGGACSGTPIAGTRLVVTAAHCVLDGDGRPGRRSVVRDGVEYRAVSVLVDTGYHSDSVARLDAAVLVLDRRLPGPAATIGRAIPEQGSVTVAGFQAVDADGSLLRGSSPHDLVHPNGATSGVIKIRSAVAGCVQPVDALVVTAAVVEVQCGLIPGSSGGGLFVQRGQGLSLVGIISTVSADITANGVVPLASLHELLQHPERYEHDVDGNRPAPAVRQTLS